MARAIIRAIQPEMSEDYSQRYTIDAHYYRNSVFLKIGARDLTALRSVMNAYMRYVSTWWNVNTLFYDEKS